MFSLLEILFKNKYILSFLNFLKYAIVVCIIPPLLNYAALNRETPVLGEHGLPYDVGSGQKLFLSCKGKGIPTIIMESPIGVNSDIWLPLQEKLSKISKVCVYDRAGLGLSDRPFEIPTNASEKVPRAKIQRGEEFTIERMAEDLHRLISSSSQQERPLMFIGSELGAMIARFYTQIYHDDVSHLVLINPLVESLFNVDDGIWQKAWYEQIVPKYYSYALGSVIGLNRFLLMADLIEPQINSNQLKEEIKGRQKHLMCNPRHLFSLVDEFMNLNETIAQMKLIWTIKQFPQNISVTILSSLNDEMFVLKSLIDEKSPKKEKLQSAWRKSVDYLKDHLHPSAKHLNFEDSIYKQLFQNSNSIFTLIEDLIVDYRRKNVVNKSI